MITEKTINETIQTLTKQFGDSQSERIKTGVQQVAERWRENDGSEADFRDFCLNNFFTSVKKLDRIFERFQNNLESLYGNLHRIYRDFNWPLHVDEDEMLPIDNNFASFNVFAHVTEDMFKTKLAFIILLNYPLLALQEKNSAGQHWPRKKWAEVRLAEQFADRVPGDIQQQRTAAYTAAEAYVYGYNLFMHNLISQDGERFFPERLRLISHWGLRDELKAQYANSDGLVRQKFIQRVMERIISQGIPQAVIENSDVDWNPETNAVFQHGTSERIVAQPEATRRYEILLSVFKAEQEVDPFTPQTPSLIDRRFQADREIPEADVEAILKEILTAPVLKEIAALLRQRLGRDLEAFDIWYPGFKPGDDVPEDQLDKVVQKRYSDVQAFQSEISNILKTLGFTAEKADYLQAHIQVDAARGAGHAMGAKMRRDLAHLRTRVPKGGMDYKGFNTAMHELGHTVEQVFTLNDVDYYTLEGVPNTAFTEAFAFVFQGRDLEVLGLTNGSEKNNAARAIHELWQTLEIAGVSLLDMEIWRWMYQHPKATAEELKIAAIEMAKAIWNDYYAPIFGKKDQALLAIYSHIIFCGMYIPDYAVGQIIAFQIEDYLRNHSLAEEMERLCRLGRLAPQVWMQQALGSPISATPMIDAAEKAVREHL